MTSPLPVVAMLRSMGTVVVSLFMSRQLLVVGIVLLIAIPTIPGPQPVTIPMVMMTVMPVVTSLGGIVIVLLMTVVPIMTIGPVILISVMGTVVVTVFPGMVTVSSVSISCMMFRCMVAVVVTIVTTIVGRVVTFFGVLGGGKSRQ